MKHKTLASPHNKGIYHDLGTPINIAVFIIVIFVLGLTIYETLTYPIRQLLKKKNEYGYIVIDGNYEHRMLVEKWMGRKLRSEEEVHHINGKRWHNRRHNLAVMSKANHRRWHARLDWMYSKKMFPKIAWQRNKLVSEFGARLF